MMNASAKSPRWRGDGDEHDLIAGQQPADAMDDACIHIPASLSLLDNPFSAFWVIAGWYSRSWH
jgi:hypothetical protein